MTTTTTATTPAESPPAVAPQPGIATMAHAFGAVLWRDVFCTGRELGTFLTQVLVQPFLTLFVFGRVLGDLGFLGPGFVQVLVPGVVALTAFIVGIQNTMLPMVVEFSWTNEIEDRLLSPMPVRLLAVEKMVFGALRGVLAAALMVPLSMLVTPQVAWPAGLLVPVGFVVVMSAASGATLGLTIGSWVPPARINMMFSALLLPLTFTGATQFPWLSLDRLAWFQWICALNPLTYASEAIRYLLVGDQLPSLPLALDLPLMALCCLVFGTLGAQGFVRRARS
jgi:ABC-2 type transport system permease protein